MNFEYFLAKRFTFQSKRSFSKLVVRLAIAAVALSLAVMLIAVSVVKGFQGEITNKVIGFSAHIQISKMRFSKSFEQDPIKYNTAFYDSLLQTDGVKHVQAFATKPGIMKNGDISEGIVIKGIDSTYNWTFIGNHFIKGGRLNWVKDSASDEIVISHNLARRLKLDIGSEVVVYFAQFPTRARKFSISGIYETGLEEVDKLFLLADLRHLQSLNKWNESQIGGYEVILNEFNDIEEVKERLIPKLGLYLNATAVTRLFPQIFDWLSLLNDNVRVILGLMSLVAAINMITALLIMIIERTRMIGLLKALGSSNWQTRKIFIISAGYLISLGVLIGDMVALIFILIQRNFGVIKLTQKSYYLSEVPVNFEWMEFLLINLGTIAFCVIMMLIPSIVISGIRPIKALRFD